MRGACVISSSGDPAKGGDRNNQQLLKDSIKILGSER